LRPSQLLALPEGQAVWQSLEPRWGNVRARFERDMGIELAQMESLLVALVPKDVGPPRPVLVIRFVDSADAAWAGRLTDRTATARGDRGKLADWAAWLPSERPGTLVLSDADLIAEMIEQQAPPPLRRELERLWKMSDSQRHVTMLFAPSFLVGDGQQLESSHPGRMGKALLQFLGDGSQAACVSAHLGDTDYLELRWTPPVDEPPANLAGDRRRRLRELPEQLTNLLATMTIDTYWQPLALRFPLMVHFVTQQTRIALEDRTVLMNAVLPGPAAHNLLLATELTLANAAHPGVERPSEVAPAGRVQLLEQPMDLTIEQQSLDAVVAELAASVQALPEGSALRIEISGPDLQLDGITRNQQIRGLRLTNRPLREILTQLVMRANPIAVQDASQPEQKLVWVELIGAPGTTTVLLTTRTAARQKGLTLPREFVAKSGVVTVE
jgi:hypothetical protein